MFLTNVIKLAGCVLMFFGCPPLISYAIVGFGAAAYSPAKYGILTELLPAEKLVVANGWIEGLTVTSIILGTMMGGTLISPEVSSVLLKFDFPLINFGVTTAAESALSVVILIYIFATLINLKIPDTGARYPHQERNPFRLVSDFANCFSILWKDKLGQISLAVTTLLWGAGATLQFIMIEWTGKALHMSLDETKTPLGITAIGMALGAVAAARFVPFKKSLKVMPLGIVIGALVISMVAVHSVWIAYPLFMAIGALSGFYIVPMNALLQHRGYVLMSAGHSIAVQNFNENLSILTMLGLYALMVKLNLDVNIVVVLFGLFISLSMLLIMRRHDANQREFDSVALIGERKH